MAGQNGSSEAAAPAERQSRQRVVLRQEVATKLQARILTWSVIALNVLFVCFAVALFSVHNQSTITASEVSWCCLRHPPLHLMSSFDWHSV
jgi:hypothetical protein